MSSCVATSGFSTSYWVDETSNDAESELYRQFDVDSDSKVIPTYYLYTWGCNEYGQLLNGTAYKNEEPTGFPPFLLETMQHHRISSISCGANSSWILNENGTVFAGGLNSGKQLVHDEDALEICKPFHLETFPAAQCVSAGIEHSAIALESGSALSFGVNEFGQLGQSENTDINPKSPEVMPLKNASGEFASQVSCGYYHTLVLTNIGEVMACGDGGRGCLGCGDEYTEYAPLLQRIPALYATPIKTVCAGAYHSMALSVFGDLYTWGRNKDYQLGLGYNYVGVNVVNTPTKVDYLDKITLIAAGTSHSGCVVVGGKLYLCGSNNYGELGHNDERSECSKTFQRCNLIENEEVLECALGTNFTIVRTSDGNIYSWGRNDLLQLGARTESVKNGFPVEVDIANKEDLFFIGISTGDAHAMALAIPRVAIKRLSSEDPRSPSCLKSDASLIISSCQRKYANSAGLIRSNSLKETAPTLFLSGASVKEVLSLIESSKSSFNETPLRQRLIPILSDAHRLNCSFIYPGRGLHSDFEGLDNIFKSLPKSMQSDVLNAFSNCLKQVEGHVQHFEFAEQTRFLLMILQCPYLHEQSIPTNYEIVHRLAQIIAKIPFKGKKALVDIAADYPKDIFKDHLVGNVKAFANASLSFYMKDFERKEHFWSGVLILSLLKLSNKRRAQTLITVADHWDLSNLEESLSIPAEHFHIDRLIIALFTQMEIVKRHTALFHEGLSGMNIGGGAPEMFSVEDALSVNGNLPYKYQFFISHLYLFPLNFKRLVIELENKCKRDRVSMLSSLGLAPKFFLISVTRENLLEDTSKAFGDLSIPLLHRIPIVQFRGEEGVDAGGVKKEFFTLVCKKMSDPEHGLFFYNEDTRSLWFHNGLNLDKLKELMLLGTLMLLALRNEILIGFNFPDVLFKKLQDEQLSLSDLRDVYPEEYRSFHMLLSMNDEELFNEMFGFMTFEVVYDENGEMKTKELTENGRNINLTFANRRNYVDQYVKYLLNDLVFCSFTFFYTGFKLLSDSILESLSGADLKLLLCGNPELNFDELEKATAYEGYTANDPYINAFWSIAKSWDIFHKQKFLKFVTGSDRAPLFGLNELGLKIQRNGEDPTNRIPTAHTCFNALLLPRYESSAKLRRMLLTAIENSEGFGLN